MFFLFFFRSVQTDLLSLSNLVRHHIPVAVYCGFCNDVQSGIMNSERIWQVLL